MLIASITKTLNELLDLLSQISDTDYSCPCHQLSNATIGEHTRHSIEMFQCLENSYDSGILNYDNRERDKCIETKIQFAKQFVLDVKSGLKSDNKIIYFYIDEIFVEKIGYAINRKYLCFHMFTRQAPGSITIHKNRFIFFFSFSQSGLKAQVFEIDLPVLGL